MKFNAVHCIPHQKIIHFESSSFTYPVHHDITTTVFWIGEPADKDNQFIDNLASVWDQNWVTDFGVVDDPKSRNSYFPSKINPKENPFNFALPYNDIMNGTRSPDGYRVYWSHVKVWSSSESMVKNKWIRIIKGDKIAYCPMGRCWSLCLRRCELCLWFIPPTKYSK